KTFEIAVSRVIESMEEKPDTLYGHFVTPAGITSARLGKKFNIPCFMAHGEATLGTIEHFGVKGVSKELRNLDGVVAVSSHNKKMLTSVKAIEAEKVKVIPNGYRQERFFPRDKMK